MRRVLILLVGLLVLVPMAPAHAATFGFLDVSVHAAVAGSPPIAGAEVRVFRASENLNNGFVCTDEASSEPFRVATASTGSGGHVLIPIDLTAANANTFVLRVVKVPGYQETWVGSPVPPGDYCTGDTHGKVSVIGSTEAAPATKDVYLYPDLSAPITGDTPTVTGTPRVGRTLTVSPGSWSAGVTFTFRWLRGATVVGSARTYVVRATDLGETLVARVIGSKPGKTSVTRYSVPTTAVQPGLFSAAPRPKIKGTLQKGRTLKAVPGVWTPTPDKLGYRWFRGTAKVRGAAGSKKKYVLTKADVGKRMSVRVTASRAGFTSVKVTSKATARVKP